MANAKTLHFYKMHSLGNDFLVLDGVTRSVDLRPEQIQLWGDRHVGVGFDQLLVINPPTDPDADFWFTIYNADGSQAEQCGNGTRCVAYLANHLNLTKKNCIRWQSLAGNFTTERNRDAFKSTMTVPVLTAANIPFNPAAATPTEGPAYALNDTDFEVTPVSMGNPHGVMFLDDIFNVDVDTIGSQLTNHPAFPNAANIGFCQVIDRQFVRLRVFERGVGETQACGSGACAAVVAAQLNNLVDHKVKVSLPGGKLRIAWTGGDAFVEMTGPATLVYEGDLSL